MQKTTKIYTISLALVSLCMLLVCSANFNKKIVVTTSPTALTKTEVITIKPFLNNKLSKDYRIMHVFDGKCWTGSIASARRDAWRCMVGNRIYDPCFSNLTSKSKRNTPGFQPVICLENIADKQVIVLQAHLDYSKANKNQTINDGLPIAIQLENNNYCAFMSGATGGINNERINYGCKNGLLIIGDLDKKNPIWQATTISKDQFDPTNQDQKVDTKNVAVEKVWY